MTIQFKDIIDLFGDVSISFSLEYVIVSEIVETVLVSLADLSWIFEITSIG